MVDLCALGKFLLGVAGISGLSDLIVAIAGMHYLADVTGAVALLAAVGGVLVHEYCPSAHGATAAAPTPPSV